MRVLFIISESNMYGRQGIMYLSGSLKAAGHEVRLVNAGRLGDKGLARIMHEYRPGIVAYSAMTGEHIRLLEINRDLKRRFEYMAVFGGLHTTFRPDLIEREPEVDALCVGEGDLAFPEFCRRVENQEAYWESPNFVVRRNGSIHRNPILPLVADLDSLPMPDHDLMYGCDPELAQHTTKTFYSSRGCPYACTYCFNNNYNELYRGKGKVLRHRSPESIIEEICYVKARYPLTNVLMQDDNFILKPPGWFERFCPEYKRRVGLPITCNFRANLVRDETIALLRDAGLKTVWFGAECGDERIANEVLRRNLTTEEILEAARIIKSHGVRLVTQNLIGLPVPDSFGTDVKTVDLNVAIGPVYAWSSILCPYPGSPIQAYAIEHGFLPHADVPYLETNKRSSMLTFSSPLEKRKIENLHKLFDFMVHYPWLRRHCDFLCALPLGGLYRALYYARFGYVYKIKLFPFESFHREIGKFVRLFFRMVRKS